MKYWLCLACDKPIINRQQLVWLLGPDFRVPYHRQCLLPAPKEAA